MAIGEKAKCVVGTAERQILVEHLAIFGSRARGDALATSDLDVIIDIQPGARFSLLNLSGVGLAVEQATGIRT